MWINCKLMLPCHTQPKQTLPPSQPTGLFPHCSLQSHAQMYEPMVARESTAMITPPSKMKPSVVVPWLGFTNSTTSRSKLSICTEQPQGAQAL